MTDLNKNIPGTGTDVDLQKRESDKTKDAASNRIVDTLTDYFEIDQVLQDNKNATPKELFSAIKHTPPNTQRHKHKKSTSEYERYYEPIYRQRTRVIWGSM